MGAEFMLMSIIFFWRHKNICMIFQYEPLIQESNIAHVHHMILYECRLSETERHYEKWVETKGAQCYTANMPVSWTACSTPIVAWAVGSDGK